FISASQAMHQEVLVWFLKTRNNEVRKLQEYLQARAPDPSSGNEVDTLHWELDRMRSSITACTADATMLLENLEKEAVCIVESGVFIPASELFERDSKRLLEIQDRMLPSSAERAERAESAVEELKVSRERLARVPATLMSYHNDERIRALKRHLVAAARMR